MLVSEVLSQIKKDKRVMLGIGPMSQNCIDATIDISDRFEIPIQLIASRRQIDSEEFGSGYVNNWSTSDFSDYVNKKSIDLNKILHDTVYSSITRILPSLNWDLD